jgi:hypothetical protein
MVLSQTRNIFLESYSAPLELETLCVHPTPGWRQGLFTCGSFRANFAYSRKAFYQNQNDSIISEFKDVYKD